MTISINRDDITRSINHYYVNRLSIGQFFKIDKSTFCQNLGFEDQNLSFNVKIGVKRSKIFIIVIKSSIE